MALFVGAAAAVLGVELWMLAHKLPAPKQRMGHLAGRFAVRRAGDGEGGWILQGTGRYDCNLRFASWQEAIQAAAGLAGSA